CRHSVISCHINDYCKSRDYTFLIPLESFEFHDPYNEYWRSKKRHRIQENSCLSTRVQKGCAITDDNTHPTLSHYGCIGSLPSVTPTIFVELISFVVCDSISLVYYNKCITLRRNRRNIIVCIE